jgi:tripartite-type tricarboxylate transporter receptor subunit TctC
MIFGKNSGYSPKRSVCLTGVGGRDEFIAPSPLFAYQRNSTKVGRMRNSVRSLRATIAALAASLLVSVSSLSAGAQNYPNEVIKIIVPFPAGGGVDVVARIIAPKLSEAFGQSVIIENRGGAGAMLGAAAVAKAAPDGYTLLLGTGSTHGTNSSVYTKLSYDPILNFTPVVLVSQSPLMLVVRPTLPVKSVAELIALARGEPGKLSFGSYGFGSITHLSAELFSTMANIQAKHVPYRGSAPALVDLLGGHIDFVFDGMQTSLAYVRSGRLRLLGIASLTRTPLLPDAPLISETLPGFETTLWFGLFAPAGTPKPIVEKINSKMNAVLALPEVRESFAKLGFDVVGGGPDVLAQRVDTELKKWVDLVREKNIHVEP